MKELIIEWLPVLFGLMALFCNTKTKMVMVNFLLCFSWVIAFLIIEAYSGALVVSIAGLSSLYTGLTKKVLTKIKTIFITFLLFFLIVGINFYNQSFSLISFLPLLAFSVYRYAELGFQEKGYRQISIIGGLLYLIYAFIYSSWGVFISETLLILANFYYLYINFYQENFTYKFEK